MTANEGMSVVITDVAPNDGAETAKALKGLSNLPVGYSDELDTHLNEYLTNLETEADAEEAAKYLTPDKEEKGAEEVVTEVEEVEAAKEPEKVVATEDEGLKRLMAREKEVADKEKDFDNRLAAAVRAKLPDFRGKGPEEVLKLAGLDPDLALKQMMFEKASDSNPVKAKLREELRDYHTKKELDSMRAELESRDAQARQQQYFQSVNDGARSYVEKSIDEKVAPVFSKLAKAELNYAHQRVMQEIIRDAQSRAARGEDGEPMSYADAVKSVEADLGILAKVLASKETDTTQSKKSAVTSPAMKTSKPLVKQYKEPTPDELVAKAIEDSVKLYHMEEAKAKGNR